MHLPMAAVVPCTVIREDRGQRVTTGRAAGKPCIRGIVQTVTDDSDAIMYDDTHDMMGHHDASVSVARVCLPSTTHPYSSQWDNDIITL